MYKLPTIALLCSLLSCTLVQAEPANDFTGRWIEQADDPQTISIRPLGREQLEARFTLGRSDDRIVHIYRPSGNLLLDENGQPVFALENGKLRQLDSKRLVLFVHIGE